MNDNAIKWLVHLSDIATCVSGDLHTIHLNAYGPEFDTLHKKVSRKYYEEAANDYDDFAEKAAQFGAELPNQNEAAVRIKYKSITGVFDRQSGFTAIDGILEDYIDVMKKGFNFFNSNTDCPISIGVANFIQTRLEYWCAECFFFNKRRIK